jgi:hypothetical protein
MKIELNKYLYPTQQYWYEYVFIGNKCGNVTRLFKLHKWKLPIMQVGNGTQYRRLAIELRPVTGSTQPQQIILVLNDKNEWVIQGTDNFQFRSDSIEFVLKLRMWDKASRSFVNVPMNPQLGIGEVPTWELEISLH